MHRLTLASLLLLLLAGCDSNGFDYFEDPYYSVYDVEARDGDGNAVLQGRIALQYVPTDVADAVGLYRGVWDLRTVGTAGGAAPLPSGTGSIRGAEADPAVLQFYADIPEPGIGGPPEAALEFYLLAEVEAGRPFSLGDVEWETRGGITGGRLESGPVTARLVREATEFIIAG